MTAAQEVLAFRTVVADPPWKYNAGATSLRSGGRGASAEHHYPTMENAEIAALPVEEIVAADAHLYLWVTNPRLIRDWRGSREVTPFDICESWGFRPQTLLTWVKPGLGPGWYFRGATEHVIFATRGRAPIAPALRERNVFEARKGRHSKKPEEFFDLVERVSPGPYLEMFARRERLGWSAWGNEVESNEPIFGTRGG